MSARTRLRREAIAAVVAARGEIGVDALATEFDASHETIRRDLSVLENAGLLLKVHGGARRAPVQIENSFDERMGENRAAKQIVASKLAGWLAPDQLIFMDTGTTTLLGAEAVSGISGLSVVTNSTRIAQAFASGPGGADVVLLGGRYVPGNQQTVGAVTVDEIARFNASCAIITVGAIDAVSGASDYDFDEAQVARAMVARARRTVVVADRTKLGRSVAYQVCPLSRIDVLVCDGPPGPALTSALNAAGTILL